MLHLWSQNILFNTHKKHCTAKFGGQQEAKHCKRIWTKHFLKWVSFHKKNYNNIFLQTAKTSQSNWRCSSLFKTETACCTFNSAVTSSSSSSKQNIWLLWAIDGCSCKQSCCLKGWTFSQVCAESENMAKVSVCLAAFIKKQESQETHVISVADENTQQNWKSTSRVCKCSKTENYLKD